MTRDEILALLKTQGHLRGADLHSVDLHSANLHSADLRRADLHSAELHSANLHSANLHSADLRGANLRGANLHSANLRGADLRRADLRGANLRGADLHGADLYSANLRGADLRGVGGFTPCQLLAALWIDLSDQLTADLMLYDADSHPVGEPAFQVWADGGSCPYEGLAVVRAANFSERKSVWGLRQRCRPWDLMVRVFAECEVKWEDGE